MTCDHSIFVMAAKESNPLSSDSLKKAITGGAASITTGEVLVATDQFDDKYETTKKELWAYYRCVTHTQSPITGPLVVLGFS